MTPIYTPEENPLVQGIKVIGIGKHGSKPLPLSQIEEIAAYLAQGEVVPVQKGAFYGSLLAKGPTAEEAQLLLNGSGTNPTLLYNILCPDAPAALQAIGVKLLNKEYLSVEEATQLGNFLFSDQPGETFRGMAASMLRMRYETDEEYLGLLKAVTATFTPGFRTPPAPAPENLIQLAEPFDGVEHSYMLTPLLAHALQQDGYPVVVTMGRTAGPKHTLNTLDLYQELQTPFLQQNSDLAQAAPAFGWALDQEILSPALDQWVERRRKIFKRPFLATLEKVLNPCQAKILITSVFHITYIEKMITLADMAGFTGVIVLKRGLEGTLAPSIAKASGITCAARQPDGTYRTQTFDVSQEAYSAYRAEADDQVQDPTAAANIHLVQQFIQHGATGNEDFDKRAHLALGLYRQGMDWINKNT